MESLQAVLTNATNNRKTSIAEAICDRGYRGTKEVIINNNTTLISISLIFRAMIQIDKSLFLLDYFFEFKKIYVSEN